MVERARLQERNPQARFTNKCPLCNHPASSHKQTKPGEFIGPRFGPRYCHHAVAAEKKGEFTICQCIIPEEYFRRAGTRALISLAIPIVASRKK